jgi:hypothetical protein
MHEDTIGSRA